MLLHVNVARTGNCKTFRRLCLKKERLFSFTAGLQKAHSSFLYSFTCLLYHPRSLWQSVEPVRIHHSIYPFISLPSIPQPIYSHICCSVNKPPCVLLTVSSSAYFFFHSIFIPRFFFLYSFYFCFPNIFIGSVFTRILLLPFHLLPTHESATRMRTPGGSRFARVPRVYSYTPWVNYTCGVGKCIPSNLWDCSVWGENRSVGPDASHIFTREPPSQIWSEPCVFFSHTRLFKIILSIIQPGRGWGLC